MMEKITETRLDSGIVVLTDRMPGVRSATLGFFFRTGSRHEPDHLNGITHFIEHCVFKGSSARSALEIANEQDRLGGNLEAFTTHEETGFVVKVVDDEFENAFSLLADMTISPRLDEADLINERRVIVEEMKMNEDSPDEVLGDIFHREFFPGHPLGLSITGTPGSVQTFDSATARAFHRHAFSPANLIIAAAGNVEHELLIGSLESAEWFPNIEQYDLRSSIDAPRFGSPVVIEPRQDLEQAHIIIATPTVSARDPRRYAADLLADILGGGTSSRLWQRVREERGLTYSIGASTAMFLDCGYMAVAAATSPEQAGEVVDIVLEEIASIVREGVNRTELDLMKDQTRASILLSLEDSAGRAASLAQCEMIHGRQIPIEETLENLAAVSLDDVRSIADEFFRADRVALIALGDLNESEFTKERVFSPFQH
ncbi:MAG TPA: pitrilysin family protein [Pyrinomonadaceae bacterium]|nr:pitrilysin family protein [Pyrinomonadaceae bacterium]